MLSIHRNLACGLIKAILATVMLAAPLLAETKPCVLPETKPRARELGIPFDGESGQPKNAITDVDGVTVGFKTLCFDKKIPGSGKVSVRTGVTAIFPRQDQTDPVFAAWYSLNGNGEMTGTTWIEESGFLEGPILITNTYNVGVVRDAVIAWQYKNGYYDKETGAVFWGLPVVAETYDGALNDIKGMRIKEDHVFAALNNAAPGKVEEGKVEEGKVKEGKVKEGKVKEGKVKEGKVKEGKVKEGKVKEGKVKEGKVKEGKVKEGKVKEGKVKEGKVKEGKVEEGKVEEGKVEEGNVGGGTGMICHEFKGGTGTASRELDKAIGGYKVGVLVQTNYGCRDTFTVAGVPVGKEILDLKPEFKSPRESDCDHGSIIAVVATDAPLLPHQLKRLARRVPLGIAKVGGLGANSSGDIFIAFSTANRGAANDEKNVKVEMMPNDQMTPLFAATVQATEEAILNALVAAETMTGKDDNVVHALPIRRLRKVLKKYKRLTN